MNSERDRSGEHRPPTFEGPDVTRMQAYASVLSAAPGERIGFCATTAARSYRVTFRRLGEKGTEVGVTADMPGRVQVCPERAWETGCGWETDLEWTVPGDARTGIYSAEFVDASGGSFHVSFAVRPTPERRGRVAVLASTNTWNAYNGWGGMSAYSSPCPKTLSLERPMPTASPAGTGRSHLVRGELWVLDWMERAGYAPDVYSDLDLHRGWDWLEGYGALAINTHGEYWSGPMRDHLDAYLASGGTLLYLSGNGLYWKVTYDSDCRVMEVRKDRAAHFQTGEPGGMWRDVGRPESAVLGVQYERPGYMTLAPYRVAKASHWAFEGTGIRDGDLIGERGLNGGAASGWEADRVGAAAPENLQVLARGINAGDYMSPGMQANYPDPDYEWDGTGGAHMVYYDHPGGGFVFSAGSIAFGGSLAVDPVLQQVVGNLLR